MKGYFKACLLWGILPLIVLFIAIYAYGSAMARRVDQLQGETSYENFLHYPSPDSRYTATVYFLNGGATSPFTTFVKIRRSTDRLDPVSPDGDVLAIHSRQHLKIEWQGNDKLVITYHPDTIYRQEKRWKDIAIIYQADTTIEIE